jgi:Chalcone isomerase-like
MVAPRPQGRPALIRLSGLLVFATGLALAAAPTAPAVGATCDDVEFPDGVSADGHALVLNGLGLRKATFLNVKVYVAGLYLPQKSADAGQILGTGQDWQLVLRFVRDVDASDMREAFQEGFEKTGADLTPLRPRIDALTGMLVDFKEGQAVSFTSDPAKGVAVAVDGAGKGAVEGEDFAAALLAIWLGPEPPNKDLKSGLLGGACK